METREIIEQVKGHFGRVTSMKERRALVEMVGQHWIDLGGPEGAAFLREVEAVCPRSQAYQHLWKEILAWREAQKPQVAVAPRAAPEPVTKAPAARRSEIVTHWCLRCGGPMSVIRPGERYCGEC